MKQLPSTDTQQLCKVSGLNIFKEHCIYSQFPRKKKKTKKKGISLNLAGKHATRQSITHQNSALKNHA